MMMRRKAVAIGLAACLGALSFSPLAAARPAAAKAASAEETVLYDVKPRDTLWDLNNAFLAGPRAMDEVARLNRIRDPRRMVPQRSLRIPRRLLRDERTRAKVESFSGDVAVIQNGQSAATTIGQELEEAATLATGRNSFLTLRLADRSVVTIPSQTRFRILRMRRVLLTGSVEREFSLENGRARMKVTPMKDGYSTFRVRTPVSHAAVRGTTFRAGFDEGTGLATTAVDEGKVGVTGAQADDAAELKSAAGAPPAATDMPPGGQPAEQLILPEFGVVVGPRGPGQPLPLIEAPKLANPGKVQSAETLQFAIEPLAKAKSYRIEIARDAATLDSVAEAESETPVFILPGIDGGSYFARIAAVDANGLEGSARTYSFQRRRNGVAGAMGRSGKGSAAQYKFKWEAETDGTPVFRFQLRRIDGNPLDKEPMVDELGLTERQVTVYALPPGEYAWKVLSTIFDQGKPVESWSSEERFIVAGRR